MLRDAGMVEAVKELATEHKDNYEILTHPDAIYSGAIGAAIWGGYRYNKLREKKAIIFSTQK